MLIYLIIGLLWSLWLEYFTTNNLDTQTLGRPWLWRERIFHTVLWPWSLGTFIYAIYQEYKRRNKNL